MQRLTGRHVLIALLAFFGVTIGVNVIFIMKAVGTFSGEVAPNSYIQGLNYNDTLTAHARQRAEGWHADIDTAQLSGNTARIAITIKDKASRPIRGLALQGTLHLPATDRDDKHFAFAETLPGHYEASIAGLRAALWELEVETPNLNENQEHAPSFEMRNRLWLR